MEPETRYFAAVSLFSFSHRSFIDAICCCGNPGPFTKREGGMGPARRCGVFCQLGDYGGELQKIRRCIGSTRKLVSTPEDTRVP